MNEPKNFSNKGIRKLGRKIRKENPVSEETLISLQEYRISFKKSVSKTFNKLCDLTRKTNKNSLVTYRLKRIDSIINKIDRFKEMNLLRMWDIAGCRCIMKSHEDVFRLKSKIEKHFIIHDIKDYISNPKENGYKSLHIFVSLPSDNKKIELQLRNEEDHNWATLVEISDLIYDAGLKEYGRNKELEHFHKLLSKKNNLNFLEKEDIFDTIKSYNYLMNLSDTFTRNYIVVRKQWLKIENHPNHSFFLIQSSKKKTPIIKSFLSYQEAEDAYFKNFKQDNESNLVLTHLPKPNYNQISKAYSNYILTVHQFLDDCFNILENLVFETLKKNKVFKFIKYYKVYNEFVNMHLNNIISEIQEVLNEDYSQKIEAVKLNEWLLDIDKQIQKRIKRNHKLHRQFDNFSYSTWYYKIIFNMIIQSQDKKIKGLQVTKK